MSEVRVLGRETVDLVVHVHVQRHARLLAA
jgi:hypothetical protein